MGSVRYLPDAGWTPVVIAPAGSTYHLTDAAGLGGPARGPRGRARPHARAGTPAAADRRASRSRRTTATRLRRRSRPAMPRRRHPAPADTRDTGRGAGRPAARERGADLARPDPPDPVVPGRPAGLDPVRGDGRPASARPLAAGRPPLELVAGQRACRRRDRVAPARDPVGRRLPRSVGREPGGPRDGPHRRLAPADAGGVDHPDGRSGDLRHPEPARRVRPPLPGPCRPVLRHRERLRPGRALAAAGARPRPRRRPAAGLCGLPLPAVGARHVPRWGRGAARPAARRRRPPADRVHRLDHRRVQGRRGRAARPGGPGRRRDVHAVPPPGRGPPPAGGRRRGPDAARTRSGHGAVHRREAVRRHRPRPAGRRDAPARGRPRGPRRPRLGHRLRSGGRRRSPTRSSGSSTRRRPTVLRIPTAGTIGRCWRGGSGACSTRSARRPRTGRRHDDRIVRAAPPGADDGPPVGPVDAVDARAAGAGHRRRRAGRGRLWRPDGPAVHRRRRRHRHRQSSRSGRGRRSGC